MLPSGDLLTTIPAGSIETFIPSGSIGSGTATLQNSSVWTYDESSVAYDSATTYYDNYITTSPPIPSGSIT